MYPHERSLVKRLANKPFALIGVNSDRDKKKLKEVVTLMTNPRRESKNYYDRRIVVLQFVQWKVLTIHAIIKIIVIIQVY